MTRHIYSLIERNGEYRLSPAYDLINTSLQLRELRIFALEKGLFKEGMASTDTRTICRSFLSPALQNQYWMAFDYRRKMLNF